jgi:group I intron endonuclease
MDSENATFRLLDNDVGFVYQWTNLINGKMYIGSHNGRKKHYRGSRLAFRNAIKKYGIENFVRDILYEGPDFRKIEEEILTNVDAASSPMYYNMKNEALGGTFVGEKNGMYGKKLTAEQRYRCGSSNRGKMCPEISARTKGEKNPMYGHHDHAHGLIARAKWRVGKTYEEIYGEERGKQMREQLAKSHQGIHHKLLLKTCPHCGREGKGPNMSRYHFDNCKFIMADDL